MRDNDDFNSNHNSNHNSNPNSNPNNPNDDYLGDLPDTWKNDDAVAALVHERTMSPDESNEAMARRLLQENVTVAVLGLVHTAQHGASERLRLDAQKYIVERVLGKVGDDAYVENPLTAFITEVTQYVNNTSE